MFFFIREFPFCEIGEFSFCGKPESENFFFFFFFLSKNALFVENRNLRILVLWKTRIGEFFFSFFFFYPRILVFWKRRILVLWKTVTGEFSFCGKPEWENFFFFLSENRGKPESEDSRFVENENPHFFVFFFIREFPFCAKRELGNSRFLETQDRRIFFFIREFSLRGKRDLENSRFEEKQNRRIFFFF